MDTNSPEQTREFRLSLENLLQAQLTRIRQRFFVHGMGTFLAVFAIAIALYYPLDRYLRLPAAVRILLTLAVAALLVYALRRFLLYPLQRKLTRRDVALAIEEKFPDLQQKLISARQLGESLQITEDPTGPRNQSRAMIDAVIADAAAHAARIDHRELLTAKQTSKVWLAASILLGIVLGFGLSHPDVAGIFLQRIFGMDSAYPRETYLVIEQPAPEDAMPGSANPEFRVGRENGILKITLAAGGDLPILVRADGIPPREVDLLVSGGRGLAPRVTMSARSGKHYKHTFRRVSGAFSFYPIGGDDVSGKARVDVAVLYPPRIEQVRATVHYPEYTRRESPPVIEGGSIEVLVGSKVDFSVTATTTVTSAKIRFLESGQELELAPFEIADDGGKRTAYRGSITVTRSDRYQVGLVGTEGLSNPHPGTYHIIATPDHPPVGKILTPPSEGLAEGRNVSLPDGLVAVRVSSRDDFGLTDITLIVTGSSKTDDNERPGLKVPLFPTGDETDSVREKTSLFFIDLAKPEYQSQATIGQSLELSVALTDNREPGAQTKVVGPRQVQVVGETELLRLVSSHFRRLREDVEQSLTLTKDRHELLLDTIDNLEQGAAHDSRPISIGINSVSIALSRIRTRASSIHRELMRAFDFHLFNRLETSAHAVTVLELYRTFHEAATAAESFFPEFYRDIEARRADGRLGAMDKILDPILAMTQSADRVATFLGPEALKLLGAARVAESNNDAAKALKEASGKQRNMIRELTELLDRLNRWNEFQDVITNTRSLLDQQRDIKARTETLTGPKKSEDKQGGKKK